MTHLDSSTLATYNSLIDPHLQCYFSNERIRSHLKHAGLIGRRGEIVSDGEYRVKLARNEHKKHVRQMLAENIVHRAIDMERARQAELRRQLDMVSKAALVNSVKESRRRFGYSTGNLASSNEMSGQSVQSSWSRPRSATHHHHEIQILNEELASQSRVQSAHFHTDQRRKSPSKSPLRRSRYLNRPKSTNIQRSSPSQRPRSPTKSSDPSLLNPSCQITMIYYGPHTKIDYDHSLFDPVDEIMVMQQHCGGENLIVYKNSLKPGEEFQFHSRRHIDYPFGLSLYVKGLIDSRISTCCEYKHRHGVRLGGERGHFAIVSVEGSKPCLKCRFDKQARMKQYGESDDENKKPIIISIPVSDQPKNKQTPVKIPVRHTSDSNENYSDDFDGSEKQKLNHARVKSPSESSSTSTMKSDENLSTKTWQVIFHTSNIPTGSLNLSKKSSGNALLKFSFLTINGNDETEEHIIQLKDFPQCFQSARQDAFRAKLRNIGKPKQIRLKFEVTGQENEDIKWHLDHIELIDPETQSHLKFPCNQWIRPFEEKLLNQSDPIRKSSASTNNSKSSIRKKQLTINESKNKVSSRSSSSSYEAPLRTELIKKSMTNQTRRISTDNESTEQNTVHYRIIIYPSKDTDGEFNASNDSRIFLHLNDQTKESFLYRKGTKYCPAFDSGKDQTFEIDLRQNINEQPTKLTIGFYNADITAGKWKLQKIVLINKETGEETIFPCKQALVRNDFNLRAEQTFHAQAKQSDDDEQSTPRNVNTTKHVATRSESDEDTRKKPIQTITHSHNRPDGDEDSQQKPVQSTNQSHNRSDSSENSQQKPVQSTKLSQNRSESDEDSQQKPVQSTKPSHNRPDSDEDSQQKPVQSTKPSHNRPNSDEDSEEKPVQSTNQSHNRSDSSENSQQKPVQSTKPSDNRSDSSESSQQKPVQSTKSSHNRSDSSESSQQKPVQSTKPSHNRPDSDEDSQQKPVQSTKPSHNRPDSDEDSEEKPVQATKPSNNRPESDDDSEKKPVQSTKPSDNRSSSSESKEKTTINNSNKTEKAPSTHSSQSEEDNEYNRMFKKNKSDASSSRPKTRRGRDDPVDPLVGLDDIQNQTGGSDEPKNSNPNEIPFKDWYPKNDDEDED